jgi:hypothetical protein
MIEATFCDSLRLRACAWSDGAPLGCCGRLSYGLKSCDLYVRLDPHKAAIGVLGDEFEAGIFSDLNIAFDSAREFLRNLADEDFGHDYGKWREWFRSFPPNILDLYDDDQYCKEVIKAREHRIKRVELRWSNVTQRRCPNCGGQCPGYRSRCWVGRIEAKHFSLETRPSSFLK